VSVDRDHVLHRTPLHRRAVAPAPSTRSLQDADLVDEVQRLLRRHGVPASRLTLEVTEGSVMADPTRWIAVLDQLREIGETSPSSASSWIWAATSASRSLPRVSRTDAQADADAAGELGWSVAGSPRWSACISTVRARRVGGNVSQTATDVTLPVDQAGTSMRGADLSPVSMSLTASPATSGREK
jgi:hypothetical protein